MCSNDELHKSIKSLTVKVDDYQEAFRDQRKDYQEALNLQTELVIQEVEGMLKQGREDKEENEKAREESRSENKKVLEIMLEIQKDVKPLVEIKRDIEGSIRIGRPALKWGIRIGGLIALSAAFGRKAKEYIIETITCHFQ